MASKWLVFSLFPFLLSRQHLLVRGDTIIGGGGYCEGLSDSLADGCTVSGDCSTITCSLNFGDQDITVKVKINKCDYPVTVTTSIKVPDLGIDWSHDFTSGDIVEVPGFTYGVGPASFGVYTQVIMDDNGDQLTLKVKLLAGAEFGEQGTYPVKLPVLDGKLPISTDECGIVRWWNTSSDLIKGLVIAGGVVVLIALISSCYCCYYCCCRSRPASTRVVVAPGAPVVTGVVTTNNTNTGPVLVPMNQYARFQ